MELGLGFVVAIHRAPQAFKSIGIFWCLGCKLICWRILSPSMFDALYSDLGSWCLHLTDHLSPYSSASSPQINCCYPKVVMDRLKEAFSQMQPHSQSGFVFLGLGGENSDYLTPLPIIEDL